MDSRRKWRKQLTAFDALGAHSRDELGISDSNAARPVQAALTSAASFAVGVALPLEVALVAPVAIAIITVSASSLVFLAVLGLLGATIGGANTLKAAARVTFSGALGGCRRCGNFAGVGGS